MRYDGKDEKMTPLPFILELLLNEKADVSVASCIGNILENLLTLQEEIPMDVDDEEEPVPLDVKFILPVNESEIAKLTRK